MHAYAVYETKQARRLPQESRAEALILVRDGFRWRAFALAGLWLALRRHWLALSAWLAALVIGGIIVWLFGLGGEGLVWVWIMLALIVGYEAAGLERDRILADEGRELGYVSGASRVACDEAAVMRLVSAIARERQGSETADA